MVFSEKTQEHIGLRSWFIHFKYQHSSLRISSLWLSWDLNKQHLFLFKLRKPRDSGERYVTKVRSNKNSDNNVAEQG